MTCTAAHAAHAFRIRLRKLLLPLKLRLESARRRGDAAFDPAALAPSLQPYASSLQLYLPRLQS